MRLTRAVPTFASVRPTTPRLQPWMPWPRTSCGSAKPTPPTGAPRPSRTSTPPSALTARALSAGSASLSNRPRALLGPGAPSMPLPSQLSWICARSTRRSRKATRQRGRSGTRRCSQSRCFKPTPMWPCCSLRKTAASTSGCACLLWRQATPSSCPCTGPPSTDKRWLAECWTAAPCRPVKRMVGGSPSPRRKRCPLLLPQTRR